MNAQARYRSALRCHTTARRAHEKAQRALATAWRRANKASVRLDLATQQTIVAYRNARQETKETTQS